MRPRVQKLLLITNLIWFGVLLFPPDLVINFLHLCSDLKMAVQNRFQTQLKLPELTLVSIDDESLSRIPDKYPFSRRFHAQVIDRLNLAGAKVIVLAEYIQARNIHDSDQDLHLSWAVSKSGRVISRNQLRYFENHKGQARWQLTPPIPEMAKNSLALGFSKGIHDQQGNIREWHLYQRVDDTMHDSMALSVLRSYYTSDNDIRIEFDQNNLYKINVDKKILLNPSYRFELSNQFQFGNFQENLSPYHRISYVDVFENKFDPELVKNRIVVIGPTAEGINESMRTIMGMSLPLVELEAHVITSLILDREINFTPNWFSSFLLILSLLIACWSTVAVSPTIYLKNLLIAIPIIVTIELSIYWIPSLRIDAQLLSPLLLQIAYALTMLSANYFVERSQKALIRKAFSHYVTASVVNEILQEPEKLKLGGARRELTVFFSDIEGFSSISEVMEIDKLVKLLNEYLTAMTDNIIFKHSGMLDKYEGDAIMAIFGAPIVRDDHAYNACLAALDNIELLEQELYPKWKNSGYPCFRIRIGINTGTMLVGNMGSRSRFDYTVIGDNVNVGSRLENLNKIYETDILISATTNAHLANRLVTRKLDCVRVRGKSLVLEIFELVGEKSKVTKSHQELITIYQQGLELYFNQNFEQAIKHFEQCLNLTNGNDKPSIIMHDRCNYYIEHGGPGNHWDLVFEMHNRKNNESSK